MLLQNGLPLDGGLWTRIGAFILAFTLGYWSSNPSLLLETHGSSPVVVPFLTDTQTPPPAFLEQSKAMHEFQALVLQSQRHPSDCARILELPIPEVHSSTISGDSTSTTWIRSFEILARGLEVAFSTERRLKLVFPVSTSREKVCENPSHHLYCALDRWASTCQERPTSPQPGTKDRASHPQSTVRLGIEYNESQFFHTHYYGPASVARLPEPISDFWPWTKSWLLDGGWSWERRWGAFWIRSQKIWFLWDIIWKGSEYSTTSGVITQSSPHSKPSTKSCSQVTIGLVLDGDAQEIARRQFARNNNKTYAWERIKTIAHHIRASHHPETQDHYCAQQGYMVSVTFPSSHALWLDSSYPAAAAASSMDTEAQLELIDWRPSTKLTSPKSSLSECEEMLEFLSTLQFLIGSFAGTWFRVATSLNLAHNIMERRFHNDDEVFHHHHHELKRYWTLDIEWLKDL